MSIEYLNDVIVKNWHTINEVDVKAKFLNAQDKIDEYIEKNLLFITANNGLRRYVSEEEKNKEKAITDLLLDWGDNQDSEKEQKNIFVNKYFDYTKPTKLLFNLVKSSTNENDYILDFFSGSATTAHSVMKLNTEDGGNRKFIMVQLPEVCNEKSEAYKAGYKNICEIGEERIRRAGEQIKAEWEKEHNSDGLFATEEEFSTDIGFKVFKLDSTNIVPWDNTSEFTEDNLWNVADVFKPDRSKEDILYEVMLKYGVFDKQVEEIEVNNKTIYRIGRRYMVVCLEDKVTSEDVKAIAELSPKTVIFKESGFVDDNAKINAVYNLEKAGVEDIKCI